jgi:3-oxoadipate enol-lactonase
VFAEVVSDRGRGATVVYLPGIDGTGQLLLSTAARLEERYRLVRLRYRLSANPDQRTYAHLAASAIETLSLRGVERMVLLAESFGGAVALQAALDFPDRVEALALVNTFAHYRKRASLTMSRVVLRSTPAWAVKAGRRIFAPLLLFGGGDRQAIDEFLGRRRGPQPKPERKAAATEMLWGLDEGYHCRMRMIQGLDLRPQLPRVGQPVVIFASDRDRIVDSVRQAKEMARALPDAELEILSRRGHVVLPVRDIDWPAHLDRLIGRATARRSRPEPNRITS